MKVFVKEIGEFRDLEVVGEYGTFHDPVVFYNGKEYVTELTDMDSDVVICQSVGCDYCYLEGGHGCRLYCSDNVEYCI